MFVLGTKNLFDKSHCHALPALAMVLILAGGLSACMSDKTSSDRKSVV